MSQDQTNKNNKSGIEINPTIIDIEVNKNYFLNIKNFSKKKVNIEIIPYFFEIKNEEKRIKPWDESKDVKLNDYIDIKNTNISIHPGKTEKTEIIYKKQPNKYLAGVYARIKSQNSNVGFNPELASIIIDTSISKEQTKEIETKLEITPFFGIPLGSENILSFGNFYKFKTLINNDTNTFLKPTGNITLYKNSTRIDNIVLTGQIANSIYPYNLDETSIEYTDTRNFLHRLGQTEVNQKITINNYEFIATKQIINIPIEIIGIITLIIFSIIIIKKLISKKTFNAKAKKFKNR